VTRGAAVVVLALGLVASAGCRTRLPAGAVRKPPAPKPEVAAPAISAAARRAVPASPIASLPRVAPLPSSPPAGERRATELARVDGREVTTSELGDFVVRYMPERAAEALDQILDERVIAAEAAREGVTVAVDAVRARTDAYVEDRRREARVQFGADVDFEALLLERQGRDFASWRADAERLVRALCLRDRLVRLDQMREDGVLVRVLVLPTEEAAREAADRIRDGADMTLYAERAQVRRPAAPPPFARGEIPEKDLETWLFAAAGGDVLDPVPFDTAAGRFWQVFKVARAWKGSTDAWSAVAAGIEASLADAPVDEEE
jgi:hypothetical protein